MTRKHKPISKSEILKAAVSKLITKKCRFESLQQVAYRSINLIN